MEVPEYEDITAELKKQNNINYSSGADSSPNSNDGFESHCSPELLKSEVSSDNNYSPKNDYSDITEVSDDGETSSSVLRTIEFSDEKRDNEKKVTVQPIIEHLGPALPIRPPDPRIPPKVDCPEKIVFCIDMSSDMIEPPFKLGNGGQFSPLCMVKRVIEMFVQNKLKIDSKHEFAVMAYHETAVWVRDFTNDVKEVNAALNQINEVKLCKESGLDPVFTLLSIVASDLPVFSQPEVVPPPFVLRVILIYGRSNCVPEDVENFDVLPILKSSPYFYLDVLYIHETPSSENKCQEVFERLCDLDDNDMSYIFEVARNTTKLHNCMAKLLAHPLQRPLQKYTYYKFSDVTSVQS